MTRRKQNLVLFLNENIDKRSINNRLVRSHMNYSVIDDTAQTEINAVLNIPENEHVGPFVISAVEISKKLLHDKTDLTHFIFSSAIDSISEGVSLPESMGACERWQKYQNTHRNMSTRNIRKMAEYFWLEMDIVDKIFGDREALICTSLTGLYDHEKTKTEFLKYQFDAMRCSVGDDLEFFFNDLNKHEDKYSVGINGGAPFRWSFDPLSVWGSRESTTILTTNPSLRLLFLTQMQNLSEKYIHYHCYRYTSFVETTSFITLLEDSVSLFVFICKLGCLFPMVISSELLHSNHPLRPRANNHREQAPHLSIGYYT